MLEVDLLVIGAGPAAMAAALSAREEGIQNILMLERDTKMGGILNQCIHSGFGLHYFKEELTGPEYAHRFVEKINEEKIDVRLNTMVLDVSPDKIVTAVNDRDGVMQIKAKSIIFAMGCRERTRGALNIPGTRPSGVLTAGAAQRFVNMEGYMPGKEVVILGSGDIGLIMARRMTLEGAKVKAVCELMSCSSGLSRNIIQCLDDFGIPLKLSHTIAQIHGKERLTGVTIAKVDENLKPIPESFEYIPCDTLLLSVGLIPENELSLKATVEIDRVTNGPVVNESMETSVAGIFACGNVVHVHDLVDFVTLESRRAGKGAADYIKNLDNIVTEKPQVYTKCGDGIRYIIPHKINFDKVTDKLQLFFRVNDVYKNTILEVYDGDRLIKSVKKPHVAPGEMESIDLSKKIYDEINSTELKIQLKFL